MFGRLARFLRIFGYDTVYAGDLESVFNLNPVPDDKLLEFANSENRIIITRDYSFHRKCADKSIYLKGEGIYNYLAQIKSKTNLKLEFVITKARCSICNSPLEKVENFDQLKKQIKPDTLKYSHEFFQCVNLECKKVFWKGTHIDDIMNKLKKIDSCD
jgi:uncharacterized protein with PIN domain